MEERRKDLMVYHYDPKKRFYLISFREQNVPGALGAVTSILGVRGVNLLEGFFGSDPKDEWGPVSFFVESTDPKVDKDWLMQYLKASIYISDIEIRESRDGFLADSVNFPLSWGSGDRAVAMRAEQVKGMFDVVRGVPGIGDDVLYKMGFQYGKNTWQKLFGLFQPKTGVSVADDLQIYTAVGWGRIELLELNPTARQAKVRFYDGFECIGTSYSRPYCHFTRGHIAGAFSAHFKADMNCTEVRCAATGEKYCEFDVSP